MTTRSIDWRVARRRGQPSRGSARGAYFEPAGIVGSCSPGLPSLAGTSRGSLTTRSRGMRHVTLLPCALVGAMLWSGPLAAQPRGGPPRGPGGFGGGPGGWRDRDDDDGPRGRAPFRRGEGDESGRSERFRGGPPPFVLRGDRDRSERRPGFAAPFRGESSPFVMRDGDRESPRGPRGIERPFRGGPPPFAMRDGRDRGWPPFAPGAGRGPRGDDRGFAFRGPGRGFGSGATAFGRRGSEPGDRDEVRRSDRRPTFGRGPRDEDGPRFRGRSGDRDREHGPPRGERSRRDGER
jgi:hypothetical protein